MTPSLETTVIIPTFNRSGYIAETISAVINQTCAPKTILIIDDGSTDTTPEVVRAFGARVTYLRQENRGKSAALNHAFHLVETELVWICDDDDVPLPHALEWLTNALVENPTFGFAYGFNGLLEMVDGAWRKRDLALPPRLPEPFSIQALRRSLVYQPGLLVRRSSYQAVGIFDESMYRSQDYEMLLRLARRFNGICIEHIVFHQRVHDGDRGPLAARSSFADRQSTWLRYDQEIFKQIYQNYTLSEFSTDVPFSDTAIQRRRALITRATIMARRGLWKLAANDFIAALAESTSPLDCVERANIRSIFDWAGYSLQTVDQSKPFFSAVSSAPTPLRVQIVVQIVRPLLYRLPRGRTRKGLSSIASSAMLCLKTIVGAG
jgi:glycosyltransferase involved in cell wall biosynthesis